VEVFPDSYIFIGFQGTYTTIPTSLGYVSYWVFACDKPAVIITPPETPETPVDVDPIV